MAQTNINIRMDQTLKQEFDAMCSELGLTMTAAFNIFARTVVRQRGIPFPVTLLSPNLDTITAMSDVHKQVNLHGPFSTVDELMDNLNSED